MSVIPADLHTLAAQKGCELDIMRGDCATVILWAPRGYVFLANGLHCRPIYGDQRPNFKDWQNSLYDLQTVLAAGLMHCPDHDCCVCGDFPTHH